MCCPLCIFLGAPAVVCTSNVLSECSSLLPSFSISSFPAFLSFQITSPVCHRECCQVANTIVLGISEYRPSSGEMMHGWHISDFAVGADQMVLNRQLNGSCAGFEAFRERSFSWCFDRSRLRWYRKPGFALVVSMMRSSSGLNTNGYRHVQAGVRVSSTLAVFLSLRKDKRYFFLPLLAGYVTIGQD